MRKSTYPVTHLTMAAALLLPPCGLQAATGAPEIVSPGEFDRTIEVATACPTFSWTNSRGASSVELVVYELPEGVEAQELSSDPVLTRKLPAGATSWTPSVAECLVAGQRYAWSVRALTAEKPGVWSEIRVFQVSERVGSALERALERLLNRYLEERRVDRATAAALLIDPSPLLEAAGPGRSGITSEALAIAIPSPSLTAIKGATSDGLANRVAVFGTTDGATNSSGVLGEATATNNVKTWGVVGVSHGDLDESAGVLGVSESTTAVGSKYGVLGVSKDANLESAGVRGEGAKGVIGVGDDAGTEIGIGVIGIASDSLTIPGTSLGDGVGVAGIGDKTGVLGRAQSLTGVAGDFSNTLGKGLVIEGGGGEPDLVLKTGLIESTTGKVTGAFDLILDDSGSELKILESAGATFFGTLDVGDLPADRTYTFSGPDGTVMTSGNVVLIASGPGGVVGPEAVAMCGVGQVLTGCSGTCSGATFQGAQPSGGPLLTTCTATCDAGGTPSAFAICSGP